MQEQKTLFRKTSLERLRSPERLDQAVQIVTLKDWLPLSLLGVLIFLGLLWSIVGRIPVTVTGQGVLIDPRRAIPLQSPTAGQLTSLNITPGQCVKKDEVLATIGTVDLEHQLQQQRDKLTQAQQQTFQDQTLRNQRIQVEQRAISAQRDRLEQQLRSAQALAPGFQKQGLAAISQQRTSLQQQIQNAQELVPILQKRLYSRQELTRSGAIAQDVLLQSELEYRQAVQEVTRLEAQLKQLEFQAVETQQRFLDHQNSVSDIQHQLDELNTKNKQLEQTNLVDTQNRDKEIQDVARSKARLEKQITENGQITSPQAGCILEVTASVGQVVSPASRLGTLQMAGDREGAIGSGVIYFAVKDGKQIQPGMKISVTPDTATQERSSMMNGEVIAVSPLPITREGAVSTIGNADVANQLIGQEGGRIEVIARLSPGSSHQRSSFQESPLKLTPGTPLTAKVTVEERSPITFLLPIVREWTGMKQG
jgi:HlyD family secretion protein